MNKKKNKKKNRQDTINENIFHQFENIIENFSINDLIKNMIQSIYSELSDNKINKTVYFKRNSYAVTLLENIYLNRTILYQKLMEYAPNSINDLPIPENLKLIIKVAQKSDPNQKDIIVDFLTKLFDNLIDDIARNKQIWENKNDTKILFKLKFYHFKIFRLFISKLSEDFDQKKRYMFLKTKIKSKKTKIPFFQWSNIKKQLTSWWQVFLWNRAIFYFSVFQKLISTIEKDVKVIL